MKAKKYIAIAVLGCVLLISGQGVEAEEATKEDQVQFYIDQGNSYAAEGSYDKAIEAFSKAIALDPDDDNAETYYYKTKAYHLRGISYSKVGRDDKALEDCRVALKLWTKGMPYIEEIARWKDDPEYNALPASRKQVILENYFDRNIADDEFLALPADRRSRIKSNFVSYHLGETNVPTEATGFGLLFFAKKNDRELYRSIKQSTKQLDKVLADFSKAYYEDYQQGMSYLKNSEHDKAIEAFSEFIALAPDHARAYFYRGYAYSETNQYDKAIEDFSKAINLGYKEVGAYYYRCRSYYETGQDDKALEDCKVALKLNPDDPDTIALTGGMYFKVALETDNTGLKTIAADYFYRAGLLSLKQNNQEKAVHAYGLLKNCDSPQLAQKLFNKLYPDGDQNQLPDITARIAALDKISPKVKLIGEYRYTYGDSESLVGAKQTCQSMAVRNALESYKTFVTATSEVKDYQLKEDLIKTVSSSYIEDLNVLEEKVTGRMIYIKVEGYIVPEILDMALRAEVQRLQAK